MNKNQPNSRKINHHKITPYLGNHQFDESYALLSHYIQLQGSNEAKQYQEQLEKEIELDRNEHNKKPLKKTKKSADQRIFSDRLFFFAQGHFLFCGKIHRFS